jgi:hypothetical protein
MEQDQKQAEEHQELMASPMLPWQVRNPWAHQQQVDIEGSSCDKVNCVRTRNHKHHGPE